MITETTERHDVCEAIREWVAKHELGGKDFRIYEDGLAGTEYPQHVWIYYEGVPLWSVINGYAAGWIDLVNELDELIQGLGYSYQPYDSCSMYLYQGTHILEAPR